TTERQIAANRENAKKSTGPRTSEGKHKSRRNALRHGLTAETVIHVLEDVAHYEALAAAINDDFRPATNFELQLMGRLVSLLWRLRRATAIESGILALQGESSHQKIEDPSNKLYVFYRLLDCRNVLPKDPLKRAAEPVEQDTVTSGLARSYLKAANYDGTAMDRLLRYESALWRQ